MGMMTMFAPYPWIAIGRHQVGVSEIPGPRHASAIIRWLERLKAWWRDDETPWCGTFVAYCLTEAGLPIVPMWMRALAWAEYGERLDRPLPGCIVVFKRAGGGHVGFLVGKDETGRLLILGGNQGNRVSIAPFSPDRVAAYVWPSAYGTPEYAQPIPVLACSLSNSTNEA